MRHPRQAFAQAVLLACGLAGCNQGVRSGTKIAAPGITIQEYMEQQINPAAEYAFRAVRDVADARGRRLEQPQGAAAWKALEARLAILRDASAVLTAPGLRV